jgi:hypothetical protein
MLVPFCELIPWRLRVVVGMVEVDCWSMVGLFATYPLSFFICHMRRRIINKETKVDLLFTV